MKKEFIEIIKENNIKIIKDKNCYSFIDNNSQEWLIFKQLTPNEKQSLPNRKAELCIFHNVGGNYHFFNSFIGGIKEIKKL